MKIFLIRLQFPRKLYLDKVLILQFDLTMCADELFLTETPAGLIIFFSFKDKLNKFRADCRPTGDRWRKLEDLLCQSLILNKLNK